MSESALKLSKFVFLLYVKWCRNHIFEPQIGRKGQIITELKVVCGQQITGCRWEGEDDRKE